MNICFLCNEYPPGPHGGVGSFTQTLGRALAARGHHITVAGLYPLVEEREEDDQGVRVIRLPVHWLKTAGIAVDVSRFRKKLAALNQAAPLEILDGPELSYALMPASTSAIQVLRMNGGHHFFKTALGERPLFWRSWLERRSFARASHYCAVSQYIAEQTRRLLGLGERPIEILPNPVDTQHFCPQPQIPTEPGLIVFVGTICEKKGIRQLLQAMPEIVAAVPEARLLVAGRDGQEAATGASFTAHLQAQIPAALAQRVEFTGHLENAALPQTLARASVCIFPSHMEAQGIVVIEGMAMGQAVVASQTGPGPELIEHGISGLLCDPHDPHSIAQQVIAVLSDAALRHRLGQHARQSAVAQFSVAALATKNEAYYERCLQNR